jgi:8-oxo-dGTP diphosphatase
MTNQPRASIMLVADSVFFTIKDDVLVVLTVTRQREPFNNFETLPGTYIRDNETSREAAKRALKSKAGVENIYMEQLGVFDEYNRDPRGQYSSVVYLATCNWDKIQLHVDESTQNPKFSPLTISLGFDHNQIVQKALKHLQNQLSISTIAQTFLPKTFTLSELQSVYQTILNRTLDKRNFRKKIMSQAVLKETGEVRTGLQSRPAKLFTYTNSIVTYFETWNK